MDKDVYYDIPIFKTLPQIIPDTTNTQNIELTNISVEKDYQLEPFSNNKNNYITYIFLLIVSIFCIKFLFF